MQILNSFTKISAKIFQDRFEIDSMFHAHAAMLATTVRIGPAFSRVRFKIILNYFAYRTVLLLLFSANTTKVKHRRLHYEHSNIRRCRRRRPHHHHLL